MQGSTSLAGNKVVARHCLAISNECLAVRHGRIVPRLAGQGRNAAQLVVAFGGRFDQHQLTGFTEDHKKVVGQKQLTVAITAVSPLALTRLLIDAREDTLIQAVQKSLVRHRRGKFATHVLVLPKWFNSPFAGRFRDSKHRASMVIAGRDENAVARQHDGLSDIDILVGSPWKPPELAAGARIVTRQNLAIEQENRSEERRVGKECRL